MRLLLTGFGPFGDIVCNPAQLVVEALAADVTLWEPDGPHRLISVILPVEFGAADEHIRNLIEAHRPDVILMLGVAAKRDSIGLERIALNLDDAPDRPDNAGCAPDGIPIAAEGPLALAATLPLPALRASLNAAGFPAVISNHAGTYLCNHVFYTALWTVERLGLPTRCGFIHVPLPRDLQPAGADARVALADLVAAIRHCIGYLSECPT